MPQTRDYLYTFAGPIADGDLIAKVDQYAAGTFSFAMEVTTTDGAYLDAQRSFQFKVAPVAQQAQVSYLLLPRQRPTANLAFSVDVASVDTDGSEFVSHRFHYHSCPDRRHYPSGDRDRRSAGDRWRNFAVTNTSAGNYSVTVPGRSGGLWIIVRTTICSSYFDGSVSVVITVTASSLLTGTATSETKTDTAKSILCLTGLLPMV